MHLGPTLYFENVARLLQGGGKVVTRLYEHRHKVAPMHLGTTLYFEPVARLSQRLITTLYYETVTRLSNSS